jgi:ribosomal protein L33
MKNKERHVFLECTVCRNRNYVTGKRQRTDHKEKKL